MVFKLYSNESNVADYVSPLQGIIKDTIHINE